MNQPLFSFRSVTKATQDFIVFSVRLRNGIEKAEQLLLASEIETLKRMKYLIFIRYALNFYEERVNFVIQAIESGNIKNKEILRNLLRGLIEIYCRVLYLESLDMNEKMKRIVWRELYMIGLFRLYQSLDKKYFKQDYLILERSGLDMSKFPNFKELMLLIYNAVYKLETVPQLRKLQGKFDFPGVKQILKSNIYSDVETPKVSRGWMYYLYCSYSEQIHSNPYMEIAYEEVDPQYGLVAAMTLLLIKFEKLACKATGLFEEDIENLITGYKDEISPYFDLLWKQIREERVKDNKSFPLLIAKKIVPSYGKVIVAGSPERR